LVQRIYDDLRFKQTDEYLKILKGNRCFKVETKGLEPGMNYYLNDVLFQMDK
jgi:THO complex subunit 1